MALTTPHPNIYCKDLWRQVHLQLSKLRKLTNINLIPILPLTYVKDMIQLGS